MLELTSELLSYLVQEKSHPFQGQGWEPMLEPLCIPLIPPAASEASAEGTEPRTEVLSYWVTTPLRDQMILS